jgi:FkbM family methyltransferase
LKLGIETNSGIGAVQMINMILTKLYISYCRMYKKLMGQKIDSVKPPILEGIGMSIALRGLKERGYVPSVVYDIGAADGGWTRQALTIWPDASFVCFEPLLERKDDLEALRKSCPKQIRIEACGVGDEDRELDIGVTDFLWDSSFAYAGKTSRSVPVRRLDTLIAEGLPSPSFMKIDVQGFERRVLDGGLKAMAKADLVLLECNFFPIGEDKFTVDVTIAYMASNGFIPYEFVDYLRRPLDGAMGQCDILFVKRNHDLVSVNKWRADQL